MMYRALFLVLCVVAVAAAWGQSVQDLTEPAKVQLQAAKTEEDRAMRAFEERIISQNDAWFADGDYRLVIEGLEYHNLIRPGNYELATNLAWMYFNIEDPTNQLRVCVDLRNSHPRDAEAWYPEAEFYFLKRAYKQVIELLEPTLKFERKPHANTYRLLGRSYKSLQMYADAARVYGELAKIDPSDLAAIKNRDEMLAKSKGG